MMRAQRIAVDPDGVPWVVTGDFKACCWRGGRWRQLPGHVGDLAVGPAGTIWAVGAPSDMSEDGCTLYRLDGEAWVPTDGRALRIAVDGSNLPWVINAHQALYRMAADGRWQGVPGRMSEIAAGPEGSIWAIGAPETRTEGDCPVFYWDGRSWRQTDGFGQRIAVGPDGLPWVVNSHFSLYRLTAHDGWEELSGPASDVAISANGRVWTLGTPEVSGGGLATDLGQILRPATISDRSPSSAFVTCHNIPDELPANELRACWVSLRNGGSTTWRRDRVAAEVRLDGDPIQRLSLPRSVQPGEQVALNWLWRVVETPGRHELVVDVMMDGKTLSESDRLPLRVPFKVVCSAPSQTSRLRDKALDMHAHSWLPGNGTSWSSGGPGFPQFATEARGCRITDLEGRHFVDYLMGWGSCFLGYANERIQGAVSEAMGSAGILTLSHRLMPEVAEMLCTMIPSAEAVSFGKNGSDVCTAAVRLARAFTGRPGLLVCGYHGWHDWSVERYGFGATGVPDRTPLVFPFEFNNLGRVAELLETHAGRIAAVMLEPAGPIEGDSGPVRDADPEFLRQLVELAHEHGALVIFDEIMTCFRYLGGTVQQAADVRPDLTCLGKALSAGMPLSALVGRREVFSKAISRIFYEPTFKGEAYSLAAAKEALCIYQEEDVPAQLWSFSARLRERVNQIADDLDLAAEVIGPPFRMVFAFREPDSQRRTLMRTLVHQELIKNGVLSTQNVLAPSAAHDDEAFELTAVAFERALTVVAEAAKCDRLAARLEIPPLG